MISTHAIQDITSNRQNWIGFSISVRSGSVGILRHKLQRTGISITRQDIIDTLSYMLSRGWIKETGLYGRDKLYSLTNRERKEKMSFKEWMQQVDRHLAGLVGLAADDLPDVCWRDWFDDETPAEEAALDALAYAGYHG